MIRDALGLMVSKNVHHVVAAYEHALLGRFARARYVVGMDARLVWLPVQALPEWLSDWILDKTARRPKPKALA